MSKFIFVYPCGHEEVLDNTDYVYGRKYNGKRPTKLIIEGDIIDKDGEDNLEKAYDWQKNVLHPYEGVMVHNGKIVWKGKNDEL